MQREENRCASRENNVQAEQANCSRSKYGKKLNIEFEVYNNVSLNGTDCLQKSFDVIFFSSYLRVIHIKSVCLALLCLQRKPWTVPQRCTKRNAILAVL